MGVEGRRCHWLWSLRFVGYGRKRALSSTGRSRDRQVNPAEDLESDLGMGPVSRSRGRLTCLFRNVLEEGL